MESSRKNACQLQASEVISSAGALQSDMDTREEEALAAQQAACKAARTARGSGPGWQPWRSWSRRHEEVANAEVQDATCSDTQVAPPSQGSSQRSSCSSAGTEEGGGTTGRQTACAQQGEVGGAAGRWKWLRDLTVCCPRKLTSSQHARCSPESQQHFARRRCAERSELNPVPAIRASTGEWGCEDRRRRGRSGGCRCGASAGCAGKLVRVRMYAR